MPCLYTVFGFGFFIWSVRIDSFVSYMMMCSWLERLASALMCTFLIYNHNCALCDVCLMHCEFIDMRIFIPLNLDLNIYLRNTNAYLHVLALRNIDMLQVIERVIHERPCPFCSAKSIASLAQQNLWFDQVCPVYPGFGVKGIKHISSQRSKHGRVYYN